MSFLNFLMHVDSHFAIGCFGPTYVLVWPVQLGVSFYSLIRLPAILGFGLNYSVIVLWACPMTGREYQILPGHNSEGELSPTQQYFHTIFLSAHQLRDCKNNSFLSPLIVMGILPASYNHRRWFLRRPRQNIFIIIIDEYLTELSGQSWTKQWDL